MKTNEEKIKLLKEMVKGLIQVCDGLVQNNPDAKSDLEIVKGTMVQLEEEK